MKNIKKKIVFLFIILSMTFILVGCGEVKVSTDTSVNIDGTSNTILKVYYDDTINTLVDNNILAKVIDENIIPIEEGITLSEINKYRDGELNVEKLTIATEKKSLKDLKSVSNEYVDVDVNKDKGLFIDSYRVDIKLKVNVVDRLSEYIKNNLSDYIGTKLSGFIGTNVGSVIGVIPYDLSITMPVNISESNSIENIDGNKIKYSYTLNELNENSEIMLSFKIPNTRNIIVSDLAIALIIIVLIIIIIRRKK